MRYLLPFLGTLIACVTEANLGDASSVLAVELSGIDDSTRDIDPGQTLYFSLVVNKADGGVPRGGHAYVYTNLDGLVADADLDEQGTASFAPTFALAGRRVMTVVVVDADGNAGKVCEEVGVLEDQPPRAVVRSPVDGATCSSGDLVHLEAEISAEDVAETKILWSDATSGPLASSWSVDGAACPDLGVVGTFDCDVRLAQGPHVLVLRLWDEAGHITTYLQAINVE